MKYYFAIALAIIAALFTGCGDNITQVVSEDFDNPMTCEEAQAYYNMVMSYSVGNANDELPAYRGYWKADSVEASRYLVNCL